MIKSSSSLETRNVWLKNRLESLLEALMKVFEQPNWPDFTMQIDLLTQEITWTIRQLNKWNRINKP